jgi:hypothetical protein
VPDLGTHVVFGFWLRRFVFSSRNIRMGIPLFLLGCVLPDAVYKSLEIALPFKYIWFIKVMHSPSSLLLQCILLSLFFQASMRILAFLNIAGGATLHLLLDSMQGHLGKGQYFWLFPFSNWTREFSLFPVDHWPFFLLISLGILGLTYLLRRKRT